MFTVMHQKDGTEHFHQAESVVYNGPFAARQQSDGYALDIVQPNATYSIFGGMAYVMNETGATVGKYCLDPVAAAGGIIGGSVTSGVQGIQIS